MGGPDLQSALPPSTVRLGESLGLIIPPLYNEDKIMWWEVRRKVLGSAHR